MNAAARGFAATWLALAAVPVPAQGGTAAGAAPATDPAQPAATAADDVDWPLQVERACTSRRYGLRLAASRRVGAAGDAAVPAVRAFAQQHGQDALPVALVESFADSGGNGDAVLQLLEAWADDREFYWRAQALRGLALRAADEALAERFRAVFREHTADPAWLTRSYARFGAHLCQRNATGPSDARGPTAQVAPADPDPRAETRLAALLGFESGLLPALGDERTFLGDPWGRRRASEAIAALEQLLGTDCGYRVEATFAENRTAIGQLVQLVAERHPDQPPRAIELRTDPDFTFAGGIEVLSCRNGDLFLTWTANGRVFGGVTPAVPSSVQLDADRWRTLSQAATQLDLPAQSGVVICDKMRIQFAADRAQVAVAPAAMPAAAAHWLKQLAAALEEAGEPQLAAALRDRLVQFAVPTESLRTGR